MQEQEKKSRVKGVEAVKVRGGEVVWLFARAACFWICVMLAACTQHLRATALRCACYIAFCTSLMTLQLHAYDARWCCG